MKFTIKIKENESGRIATVLKDADFPDFEAEMNDLRQLDFETWAYETWVDELTVYMEKK